MPRTAVWDGPTAALDGRERRARAHPAGSRVERRPRLRCLPLRGPPRGGLTGDMSGGQDFRRFAPRGAHRAEPPAAGRPRLGAGSAGNAPGALTRYRGGIAGDARAARLERAPDRSHETHAYARGATALFCVPADARGHRGTRAEPPRRCVKLGVGLGRHGRRPQTSGDEHEGYFSRAENGERGARRGARPGSGPAEGPCPAEGSQTPTGRGPRPLSVYRGGRAGSRPDRAGGGPRGPRSRTALDAARALAGVWAHRGWDARGI